MKIKNIIKKAIERGYEHELYDLQEVMRKPKTWEAEIANILLDPVFWKTLFKYKKEEWQTRQRFFGILFGDADRKNKGLTKAVAYLEDIIK